MKLRPVPTTSRLDFFEEMERDFARMDALQALGLPLVQSGKGMSEEEIEDAAHLEEIEEITRPWRLAAQAALQVFDDALLAAATAAAAVFEAGAAQAVEDQEKFVDPQAAALGLASLNLAPRIMAQRPITARATRAGCAS